MVEILVMYWRPVSVTKCGTKADLMYSLPSGYNLFYGFLIKMFTYLTVIGLTRLS